jgi:hypothetical protein
MRKPTPYDFTAACRLLAPVEWTAACGPTTNTGPQHDHDEALGRYSHQSEQAQPNSHLQQSSPRPRDGAYWDETADLMLDYFELLAGVHRDELFDGFIKWLQRSPAERKCYETGDDMTRATLVDWYLKIVR